MISQEVLALLRGRNQCLKQIITLSREFLACNDAVLEESLGILEKKRERAMKKYTFLDRKLSEIVDRVSPADRSPEWIAQVLELARESETHLAELIASDEEVQNRIQTHSDRLKRELQIQLASQSKLNRFKSTWIKESGEGIDKKL